MSNGAVRRPRAPGSSQSSVRAREAAELARVIAAQAALPPLSAVFVPSRPNRRQRTAANAACSAVCEAPPAAAAAAAAAGKAPGPTPVRLFSDLPLSTRTRDGLAAARFAEVTDVQRLAVPQALAGRDVLAAAPTGSGKTLAFVVPVLEALWRAKWSTCDGLGALVLAPTRELALQIFEVFRAVAKFHMISAGLVIGGKDFEFEREKVGHMNVLVATPGRLLHHMDHVADLDCSTLQVLVLDEADRILDMGFSRTLDAIIENLPTGGRQTLLFSATQTKSVKALARLSLRSPQYVSVTSTPRRPPPAASDGKGRDGKGPPDGGAGGSDSGGDGGGGGGGGGGDGGDGDDEDGDVNAVDGVVDGSKVGIAGTPRGLSQSYTAVVPQDKLSVLWSFIKTHVTSKVIVFFATGKQVRFVYEAFCKLRPGIPLLHLHGKMKQTKRTDVYDLFCRTRCAALFATDIASRGLDFPDVEWVVQVDCPDDVSAYVHRVGRTARFRANGRAMLLLNRGREENFLKRLGVRKLHLNRTRINPERISSITPRVAALVAQNSDLKMVAQRAFTFYLKSVHRQQDKEVFDATDMDHAAFATSLGLSSAPRVTFRGDAKRVSPAGAGPAEVGSGKPASDGKTVFGYRPRAEAGRPRRSSNAAAQADHGGARAGDDCADEGGTLLVKRVRRPADDDDGAGGADGDDGAPLAAPVARKRKRVKLDVLRHGPSGNRLVFADDGTAMRPSDVLRAAAAAAAASDGDEPADIDDYASAVARRLEQTASADKAREHDRVRTKHARRKELLRGKRPERGGAGGRSGDEDDGDEDDAELTTALAQIAARSVKTGEDGGDDSGAGGEDEGGEEAEEDDLAAQALRILKRRRLA
jgi:ATP-dependent RNA helicase DDX10/DBP4